MKCPKCKGSMASVVFKNMEVEKCQECSGIWFDMNENEKLRDLVGAEFLDDGNPAVGTKNDRKDRIKCPVDRAGLIRMVDVQQSHIWYEGCPVCYGVYFDAGEFKDFKEKSFLDTVRSFLRGERL